MNAHCSLLKSFDSILVEYHFGHRDIIKKLDKCGFEVKKISGRTYMPQIKTPINAGARFSISGLELNKEYVIKPYMGYILGKRSLLKCNVIA